jgi:hypothetical protein
LPLITRTHRRNEPVKEYVDNNFALDRKIEEAVFDLKPILQCTVMKFSDKDRELIADFIAD